MNAIGQLWTKRGVTSMIVLLTLLNIVILIGSIALGERYVPLLDALMTALGFGGSDYVFTIRDVRLPRALTGFLAGWGLALSGTILQTITRNPLASPGVIGLNSGAAAAVVTVMILVPSYPTRSLPVVAFGGALIAVGIIYWLAWSRGSSPVRMMLIGIGISAMAGALVTYLLTIGNIFRVSQAFVWMAGSLYGRTWEHFWPLFPWMAILFVITMLLSHYLDLIRLGDETAIGLGLALEKTRLVLILISVGFAGSAVSMAGTIAFVGLMAPHMAARLVGGYSARKLPVAGLLGGLIVMLADLIGRLIFSPFEIPVGLVTAIIGAPYMAYLLLGRKTI